MYKIGLIDLHVNYFQKMFILFTILRSDLALKFTH